MKLSKRQREIAGLLADGKNAIQIANLLKLSVRTVHNHLSAARKKKNAKTSLQLAIYVRSKRKPEHIYSGS